MTTPIPPHIVEEVGTAILDAHSQWELENNRLGGQMIWETAHLNLLASVAATAAIEAYLRAKGE